MTPGNTEFRPIHNPYIVGNPIRDLKMFYGREDDESFVPVLIDMQAMTVESTREFPHVIDRIVRAFLRLYAQSQAGAAGA